MTEFNPGLTARLATKAKARLVWKSRLRDAAIKRVDRPAGDLTRPVGTFDMGQWDIRPTDGAAAVVVFVQHSCRADDLRSTKMADVSIKP